jgi:hypothetical protein
MTPTIRVRRLDNEKVLSVSPEEIHYWREGYNSVKWWMTFKRSIPPTFGAPFIRSAPGSAWGVAVEVLPVLTLVSGGERREEART